MNRLARAWVKKVSMPASCPICGEPIGRKIPAPSEKIPLVVMRQIHGEPKELVLHAGCQAACTAEELEEIRL